MRTGSENLRVLVEFRCNTFENISADTYIFSCENLMQWQQWRKHWCESKFFVSHDTCIFIRP